VAQVWFERMIYSARGYWWGLAGDLVGVAVFLTLTVRYRSGSIAAAAAFVLVGFTSWGLLEYSIHRWILHGPPSMARRGHARHHADGSALVGTPALVAAAAAVVLWSMLAAVCGAGVASALIFGLYAGYNYYALAHHWQHGGHAPVPYLERLERAHRIHHVQPTVNYGVTTTLWDRVFGTCTATGSRADGVTVVRRRMPSER
jgi:sterol desaturase/sphingolipid hydroxylase (fatty acid hydroxylase superfamily)